MNSFKQLEQSVRGRPKRRLVAAAANDEHTVEALLAATRSGAVDYLLTGDREKVRRVFSSLGEALDERLLIHAPDDVFAARAAVGLVRDGKGDFLMKGMLPTATLLKEVVSRDGGLRGEGLMSHAALLEVPGRETLLLITDGGMLPHPDLAQKAAILKNGLGLLRALGIARPKAAALAAVETVSERMPETVDGAALAEMAAKGAFGDCVVAGPISFDLAVSSECCRLKRFTGPVEGDAELLLVPDIASGNMMSKSLILFGGAEMCGCVLGARVPIVVCTRAATTVEKFYSIMLAAALC